MLETKNQHLKLLRTFFDREKTRMIVVLVKYSTIELQDLATQIQANVTESTRDKIL